MYKTLEMQASELDFKASSFNVSIQKETTNLSDVFILTIAGINGEKVEKKILSFNDLPSSISELISSSIGLIARAGCPNVGLLKAPEIKLSKRINLIRRPAYEAYCPDCDFDNEDTEYTFCPDCGTYLVIN